MGDDELGGAKARHRIAHEVDDGGELARRSRTVMGAFGHSECVLVRVLAGL
jgi:hypothetical protein